MLPYLIDDKDNSARAGDESMRYLEGETMSYPRNDDNFVRTHGASGNNGKMVSSIMKKRTMGNKLDVVSEVSE
jgi:hypothetical protein